MADKKKELSAEESEILLTSLECFAMGMCETPAMGRCSQFRSRLRKTANLHELLGGERGFLREMIKLWLSA